MKDRKLEYGGILTKASIVIMTINGFFWMFYGFAGVVKSGNVINITLLGLFIIGVTLYFCDGVVGEISRDN